MHVIATRRGGRISHSALRQPHAQTCLVNDSKKYFARMQQYSEHWQHANYTRINEYHIYNVCTN